MRKLYIGLASLFLASLVPVSVFAYTKSSEDSIVISQNEVINDDVFVAAESLVIEGVVNGDVYATAGRVRVSGTVNGDVIVVARLVEVSGVISEDLRAAGNTIQVSSAARIGDSFSAAGNDISLSADSAVGGGIQVAGAAIDLGGSIGRGVMAAAEDLEVNAVVAGDIKAGVNEFTIGKDAEINGKATYYSSQEAKIDDNAQLATEPERIDIEQPNAAGSIFGARIVGAMIGFAMAFVTGVAIILISKRHTRHIGHRIIEQPAQNMAVGLLGVVAGIPLAVFLIVTLVGIPLGIITLVMWGVGLYVAKIFAAVAVGVWILRKGKEKSVIPSLYQALATGLGLYYLLSIIPLVGFLAGAAATTAGLGALLTEIYRSVTHESKSKA